MRRNGAVVFLPLFLLVISNFSTPTIAAAEDGNIFYRFVTLQQQQQNHQPMEASSTNQLEYDFYRNTCPVAEEIIRNSMIQLFDADPTTGPQLLRLFFHDCFVGGCDASILLDESGVNRDNRTEKDAPPNRTLRGFDKIAIIKARLEQECPATVSCADTLALAAREGVTLAGGPSYPLLTGRGDSDRSHFQWTTDIPSPDDPINVTLTKFRNKRFNERETVSLLGAHSFGSIGCEFIESRLHNFRGSGRPDQSLNTESFAPLISLCSDTTHRVSSGTMFDSHYFKALLNHTALLFSDQQLTVNSITRDAVHHYARDDGRAFRRDFARAMVRMSVLGVFPYEGSVRLDCARAFPLSANLNAASGYV